MEHNNHTFCNTVAIPRTNKSVSTKDEMDIKINLAFQDCLRSNCKMSDEISTHAFDLAQHMNKHTEDTPFTCDHCEETFCNMGSLTQHVISHMGMAEIKCLVCDKMFTHSSNLNAHIKQVHTEKHLDAYVEKSLSQNHHNFDMPPHVNIGKEKKKIHKCDICFKTFSRLYDLANHRKIHTGEKPFQCSHCGKHFAQKQSIISHLRIHKGQKWNKVAKTFKCQVCSRVMARSWDLMKHRQIHIRKKSLKCPQCNKSFIEKAALKSHMDVHNSDLLVSGNTCTSISNESIQNQRHTEERKLSSSDCSNSITCTNKIILNEEFKRVIDKHMKPSEVKEVTQPSSDCNIFCQLLSANNVMAQPSLTHNLYFSPPKCSQVKAVEIKSKSHGCGVCFKKFTKLSYLKMHMKNHTEEKAFVCSHCYQVFKQEKDLTSHTHIDTGEKTFNCDKCSSVFTSSASWLRHMSIGAVERPFKCPVCKNSFIFSSSLNNHMDAHYGKKKFSCELCTKRFSNVSNRNRHIRLLHNKNYSSKTIIHLKRKTPLPQGSDTTILMARRTGNKAFNCHICRKTFLCNSSLKSHMTVHSDEQKFRCFFCEKMFFQVSNRTRHTFLKHSARKSLKTTVHFKHHCLLQQNNCEMQLVHKKNGSSNSITQTKWHPQLVHTITNLQTPVLNQTITPADNTEIKTQNNISCRCKHDGDQTLSSDICSTVLSKPSRLVRHMHTHSAERPFICSICYKTFKAKSKLNAHMVVHTGERNFSCAFCEKSFSTFSNRNTHMRNKHNTNTNSNSIKHSKWHPPLVHTNTELQTPILNQTSDTSSLVRDKRTHSEKRSFICSICCKSFKSKSNLNEHMIVHTGERNYSCAFCEKSFSTFSNRNTHVRHKHNAKKSSKSIKHSNWHPPLVVTNTNLQTDVLSHNLQTYDPEIQKLNNKKQSYIHIAHKTFTCEICFVVLSSLSNLTRHMRIHSGERPFICPICSKTFIFKSSLNKHKTFHTGGLKFSCDFCEKYFFSPNNRNAHVQLNHSANKGSNLASPWHPPLLHTNTELQTPVLNQTLEISSDISSRVKNVCTHSGERLSICSICFKSFKAKSKLNAHMIVHTGERNYSCNFCEKTFSTCSNRNTHMRRKHNTTTSSISIPLADKNTILQTAVVNHTLQTSDNPETQKQSKTDDTDMYTDEKKSFLCDICALVLTSSSSLVRHLRIHSGERPFICSICSKDFIFISSLNKHMRVHTDGPRFSCDICDKSFSSSSNRNTHVRNNHKPNKSAKASQWHPPLVHTITDLQTSVESHTMKIPNNPRIHKTNKNTRSYIHIGQKTFTCKICAVILTSSSSLVRHMRIHSGERPFICSICSKSFIFNSSLNKHMNVHTGERNFSCEFCEKKFSSSSNRNTHVRRKHNANKNSNSITAYKWHSPLAHTNTDLTTTVLDHTIHTPNDPEIQKQTKAADTNIYTGEKKSFLCDICAVVLTTFSSLVRHMRIHSGDRPYICSICSRCFMFKSYLTKHMIVHTGRRKVSCDFCEKSFSTPSNRNTHVRIKHNTNKSFNLTFDWHPPLVYKNADLQAAVDSHTVKMSGNREIQKTSKRLHSYIHIGQKKFTCKICAVILTSSSSLVRHMRIHSGERPFICSICSKSFIFNSSLNKHMNVHTGERKFSCDFCKKTFSSSSNRNTHVRRKHNTNKISN